MLRFYRDGAAVQRIARELAMPVNTVKSHLRRARLALASRLAALLVGERGPHGEHRVITEWLPDAPDRVRIIDWKSAEDGLVTRHEFTCTKEKGP